MLFLFDCFIFNFGKRVVVVSVVLDLSATAQESPVVVTLPQNSPTWLQLIGLMRRF